MPKKKKLKSTKYAMEQEAEGIRAKGVAEAEAIKAKGIAESRSDRKESRSYEADG